MTDWTRSISRRIGRFVWDRRVLALLVAISALLAGRAWLLEHPEHNPWAPLDLRDPPGWATAAKLRALEGDAPACRAVLARSQVAYSVLPAAGEGACARPDRTLLEAYPFSPDRPPTTCTLGVALTLWERDVLARAAEELFDSKIERIEHLGAYSCRRLYGRGSGPWSEHATGNAIDIAGFVLADGTRITVLRDWTEGGAKAEFLRRARDGACRSFSTVLSPDYNAAHADHFHFDMRRGWGGVCR
jgi:hypothetical protein